MQYDSNGNLLTDNQNSYTWDQNWGNPASVNATNLVYDALGRMVEQQNGTAYTQIVYSAMGKTSIMNGQTLTKAFVYLPGGGTGIYNSTGLAYYRHADWLGSSRLTSTASQGLFSSLAYAPFGEQYAQAGTPDPSFTGQDADTTSSLYDFLYREHSPSQGRWVSPDPAGLSAVDLTTPETWNRYAYVMNNPLAFIDPSGLQNGPKGFPDVPGLPPGELSLIWDEFSIFQIDVAIPGWGSEGPTWVIFYNGDALCVFGFCSQQSVSAILQKIKNAYCRLVPNGRTEGISGSAGSVAGITGTAESVMNWDTGQTSLFTSGGLQGGLVGLGGSVFFGPVWGLNAGNTNYKNGSTTFSGSGPILGGAASFNSPGLSDVSGSLNMQNLSLPASLTASAGLNVSPISGGVSVTNYSSPQGTMILPPTTITDLLGMAARLPCH